MSSFKRISELQGFKGVGDDDDSDDSDDEEEEQGLHGKPISSQGAAGADESQEEDDDEEDEDEDDEDEDENDEDEDDAAPASTIGGVKTTSSEQRAARKKEASWLAANFIKVTKSSSGANIYKTDLLPDKVFFQRDKLKEFVEGKRYKRLLHEMRKGMRTHSENEKLKSKAAARRERQNERRVEHRRDKLQKLRAVPAADDTAEIERRKAKFQEKKLRRLERKRLAQQA